MTTASAPDYGVMASSSATPVPEHGPGLEILDDVICRHLLEAAHIGRLGFTSSLLPVVLPVNFVVDGDSVVIATESPSVLRAAVGGHVACIEVDDHDALTHEGWSVLATGRLREVTDRDELAFVEALPLAPWRHLPQPRYVRLPIELLSGRRLQPL